MAAATKTVPTAADVEAHFAAQPAEREAPRVRLGKRRQVKSCVCIKRLADVDQDGLEELCMATLKEKRA